MLNNHHTTARAQRIVLESISRSNESFEHVKNSYTVKFKEEISKIEKRISTLEGDIARLESSETEVKFEAQSEHLLAQRSSTFMSWTLLGGGRARGFYSYTATEPFVRYEVTPSDNRVGIHVIIVLFL